MSDPKDDLHHYLQLARDALVWKLEGLGEYDIRRPLTPTGTNLLGLVKHCALDELGYLGEVFGRVAPELEPWLAPDVEPNSDMWATPEESREEIVAFYRRACAHGDETIAALPLDATGRVPWWPPERGPITLHRALVHLLAETHRHAGHADVMRELVDGAAGLRADSSNLPDGDAAWWAAHRQRVEDAARAAVR